MRSDANLYMIDQSLLEGRHPAIRKSRERLVIDGQQGVDAFAQPGSQLWGSRVTVSS
jgi:hypothetical protein